MSPSHRDHRSRGTLGTTLLAGVCCVGAVAYGVVVGPSMLPPQDVQATSAMTTQAGPDVAEEPEESVEEGPTGHLKIQVSDRGRAWVQTLMCTGDLEKDPAECAELAQAAEELHGDTGRPVGNEETASDDAAPTEAAAPDGEGLFTEVREGTVCTDEVYGPQEATIVGTWEGQEVETTLTRKGSCEEARWQRLRALTDQIS
ncbi:MULTISPECIES: hypothetical protein [Nocardiopsis]|uniref:Uncharacterized protein n=1 Tax=Nocardiopsis sinuspersici TaxID=501010 RepID=A0A1V3BXB6_9ACTN|nr:MULTISPECIES: hypothetical protein [Nocardiopsis]NYH54048.1 hypothetical protein [Nocardiopsis sinuspersici]OOC52889.1 hypothetical protein NOSIN_02880 [Nocardiopsis sinuspersici]